ncbi:MAG: hypothetical protein KME21_31400 [Desmonostoc vinosum HA7617-LM4]|nr:hypothetical protein [Desmonostoc vinosum HA7617-LM4]
MPPKDERDVIFSRWLNRDEAIRQSTNSNSVSVTNNIDLSTQVVDTIQDIPQT